jgi:outer membrane protein assembly factor BamB
MRTLLVLAFAAIATADWTQWGGPNRNFQVDAPELSSTWPAGGPKRLWSRPLGDGYSAVLAAGTRLYTMYRRGHDDVVIALEAATGNPVWEFAIPARHAPGMGMEHGPGPHSTPLLAGGRLFAISVMGHLHALDAKTGKLLWAHDLWNEFGGTRLDRGYASSPIAYRDTVIAMVGGKRHAVMAFRQADGKVAWHAQDFANTGSSPVLINVGGLDQLVVFMAKEVAGLNPLNGDLQWRVPHATDWDINASTPVYGPDGILFISSAYSGGSQGIQLTREGNRVVADPLWKTNRMRLHHGNAIRTGDHVYGSSGDFGPAPVTALDVKTGRVSWQDRGFAKANFVYAAGKLIALDEDGTLGLLTVSPKGGKVLAQAQILNGRAWTVPTLAGTVLYVRDRSSIAAFDLK